MRIAVHDDHADHSFRSNQEGVSYPCTLPQPHHGMGKITDRALSLFTFLPRCFVSPGNHCIREPGYRHRMEHHYGMTARTVAATAHRHPGFFCSFQRSALKQGRLIHYFRPPAVIQSAHVAGIMDVPPRGLNFLRPPVFSFLKAGSADRLRKAMRSKLSL